MAAASLKTSYRITRIETVDSPAMPGVASGTKVVVTGSAVSDPAAQPGMPNMPGQLYQWSFDDPTAAAEFFNVNETVDVTFTKISAPAQAAGA